MRLSRKHWLQVNAYRAHKFGFDHYTDKFSFGCIYDFWLCLGVVAIEVVLGVYS